MSACLGSIITIAQIASLLGLVGANTDDKFKSPDPLYLIIYCLECIQWILFCPFWCATLRCNLQFRWIFFAPFIFQLIPWLLIMAFVMQSHAFNQSLGLIIVEIIQLFIWIMLMCVIFSPTQSQEGGEEEALQLVIVPSQRTEIEKRFLHHSIPQFILERMRVLDVVLHTEEVCCICHDVLHGKCNGCTQCLKNYFHSVCIERWISQEMIKLLSETDLLSFEEAKDRCRQASCPVCRQSLLSPEILIAAI